MSPVGGKNSGRFRPVPGPSAKPAARLTSARRVVLGAVLAGVLTVITGWTTGAINAAVQWLGGDSSPVQIAVVPAAGGGPTSAGSPVPSGGAASAAAPATGNGLGSPSPREDGRVAIGNANFEVSESVARAGASSWRPWRSPPTR
ncbi:hypothetical protein ACQP2P_30645 [Dactylosporangium sp. CA-139114]|uniref:hypothetical protein n=1 Tax=Dactylosporangium sp. CA-139114 TaxID=3239931 RepID=UPI003D9735A6